jgi:hypothetical protein
MTLKEAIKEYYDFLRTTPWGLEAPSGWWNRFDCVVKNISLTTVDRGRFIVDDIRPRVATPNATNAPLVFEKGRLRGHGGRWVPPRREWRLVSGILGDP